MDSGHIFAFRKSPIMHLWRVAALPGSLLAYLILDQAARGRPRACVAFANPAAFFRTPHARALRIGVTWQEVGLYQGSNGCCWSACAHPVGTGPQWFSLELEPEMEKQHLAREYALNASSAQKHATSMLFLGCLYA